MLVVHKHINKPCHVELSKLGLGGGGGGGGGSTITKP